MKATTIKVLFTYVHTTSSCKCAYIYIKIYGYIQQKSIQPQPIHTYNEIQFNHNQFIDVTRFHVHFGSSTLSSGHCPRPQPHPPITLD